ncbi:MAG: N-acetylmuramoyl-L-alanine amidase [Puniceicoccales bacterium]|jgi:N-acetylmuramoyl-L-alanine amidase|nr:N-acetylmuramoyl-L-alanine amidase [Puniceicoccales bacterium]
MIKVNFYRRVSLFLVLVCGFVCSLCHALPNGEYMPLEVVAKEHLLRMPIRRPDRVVLRGDSIELSFRSGSLSFHANGVLIPLGFFTETKCGKLCVSYSDYVAHLRPFFTMQPRSSVKKAVIVLDPGHGGRAEGALSATGLKEKTVTLDICQRLARILEKQGHTVYLTRNSDVYVELEDRTKFANKKSPTMFVSVHCNAAKSKSARGVETFALTPCGQPSQHQVKSSQSNLKPYAGNKFDAENLILAYAIQGAVLRKIGCVDRGVKHACFHVFRGLNCPGVLAELEFLSHPIEAKKLASSNHRQDLAQGLADGITSFLKCHIPN